MKNHASYIELWMLNSVFTAQLVGASHWYCEVMGSNPVEVLTFSGFNIRNCINCVHNCEDHSSLYIRLIFYKTKVA